MSLHAKGYLFGGLGLLLLLLGFYLKFRAELYQFNNRTSGCAVRYRTYLSCLGVEAQDAFGAIFVLCGAYILFIAGMAFFS